PRCALARLPASIRCLRTCPSASDIVPLSYAIYNTTYFTRVSPARPLRADSEIPPPCRRSGGNCPGSLLERERAVASYSVDLRTPGGRGVWVDRSPTRSLSHADGSA